MSTTPTFPHLQGHNYMNLTTWRKNGTPVTTPVWFAQEGDKLVVYTQANAGKVKRIRNNANVEVGPCTARGKPLGATQPATARILPADASKEADQLLTRKYGWQKRIIAFMARLRGGQPAYLEIRPPDRD